MPTALNILKSTYALFSGMRTFLFTIFTLLITTTTPAFSFSNEYSSPRNSERDIRKSTKFIILHTTEAVASSALRKLSANGEAHYCIDRQGKIYRIIRHNKVAYHCGRSMWNGLTNLDDHSVGIEIVGYHNKSLTLAQYDSIKQLVKQLQAIYKIPDQNVMPHSQVAYGTPNRWHKKSHRGRKRCCMSFATQQVRKRIDLKKRYLVDPDVKAKRLVNGDNLLAEILYSSNGYSKLPFRLPKENPQKANPVRQPTNVIATQKGNSQPSAPTPSPISTKNIITQNISAWDIARDAYNAASTIYVFPDGKRRAGDTIIDWSLIQAGTEIILGDPDDTGSPVQIISSTANALALAGVDAFASRTFYILPSGNYYCGTALTKNTIDALPIGTRVLTGYRIGGPVSRELLPSKICSSQWKAPDTFYLINGNLTPATKIDFSRLPIGTMIFYKE